MLTLLLLACATDPSGDPSTLSPPVVLPPEEAGCEGTVLLERPAAWGDPGPWPVGARTVTVDDMTVEVWYPAVPGSERGLVPEVYDIRLALPESEQARIPDDDAPLQPCLCWRDLPVDAVRGPYPVVIFFHGTAGFRTQSLEFMTHWASRGFVVLAADHPGLWLQDLLNPFCGGSSVRADLDGDLATLAGAVTGGLTEGPLAFLAGVVDASRLATAGHSAGGGPVAVSGDVAQVAIPMAAGGVEVGTALRSTLVLGALSDQVVPYESQQEGFAVSPAPRRLVGIANTGHLAFSSLCSLSNAEGQDIVAIGEEHGVCGLALAGALFDCSPDYLPDADAWEVVQHATSSVLEESLHCSADAAAGFEELADWAAVAELQEVLAP